MQTRIDPLVAELVNGVKANEADVKRTMLRALESVVKKAGGAMSDASKSSVAAVIISGLADTEGNVSLDGRVDVSMNYL